MPTSNHLDPTTFLAADALSPDLPGLLRPTRPKAASVRPPIFALEPFEQRVLLSGTSITGSALVDEGSPYVLHFQAAPPAGASWAVDWGDGTAPESVAGTAKTATHVYADGPATPTISASAAGVGDRLDPAFGAAGTGKVKTDLGSSDDFAYRMALQPDGKIVLAGGAGFSAARYYPDGTLDSTFGTGGKFTAGGTDSAFGVAVQPDGKILLGGGTNFALARLNADGKSLDPTFGGGTGRSISGFGTTYSAFDMALLPSGKILMAGRNGQDLVLARFNADGSVDASFATAGKARVDFRGSYDKGYAIAVQPDGRILVVGQSRDAASNYDWAIARFTAQGALDASFGSGGKVTTDMGHADDAAWAVSALPDGRILVAGRGGSAATGYDFALARYSASGQLDASFGPAGSGGKVMADFGHGGDQAYAMAVLPDGKILLVGRAESSSRALDFGLARFHADGTRDLTFGDAGLVHTDFDGSSDYGESVAVQRDGDVVVGGASSTVGSGGATDFALARYGMDSASTTVEVVSEAPVVAAGRDQTVDAGVTTALTLGAVTDPGFRNAAAGTDETFTATIDWGDGAVDAGVAVETTAGSAGVATRGRIKGSHRYATAGTYGVTVTVTDDDGATSEPATLRLTAVGGGVPTFTVPGTAGTTTKVYLQIKKNLALAGAANELGLFVVNAADQSVGGVLPGDSGYAAAALGDASRRIVFTPTAADGQVFSADVPAGSQVAFYLVYGGTTAGLLADNPDNLISGSPHAWFTAAAANPDGHYLHFRRSELSTGGVRYEVEDLPYGGDADFDDLVFTVGADVLPTLAAVADTPHQRIDLTWQDVTNAEQGFVIERSANDDQHFGELARVSANVTTWSDTAATPGVEYHYRIRSFTDPDAPDAPSNVAVAELDLAQPRALYQYPISGTAVRVAWTEPANAFNSTGVGSGAAFASLTAPTRPGGPDPVPVLAAGYRVYVRDRLASGDAGPRRLLATLPPHVTTYQAEGLDVATPYTFEVEAFQGNVVSDVARPAPGYLWERTDPTDESGWYVVSIPKYSGYADGNKLSFVTSDLADTTGGYSSYSYPQYRTFRVEARLKDGGRVWASSATDAIQKAFVGTVRAYDSYAGAYDPAAVPKYEMPLSQSGTVIPLNGHQDKYQRPPVVLPPGTLALRAGPPAPGSAAGSTSPPTEPEPVYVNTPTGQYISGFTIFDEDDTDRSNPDFTDDQIPVDARMLQDGPGAGQSDDPVRYSDGSLVYQTTDLESDGFDGPFGQRRSWTSEGSLAPVNRNGWGMTDNDLPTLVRDLQSGYYGYGGATGSVGVVTDPASPRWFNGSGYGFAPSFGGQDTLASTGSDYVYTDTAGNQYTFDGFDSGLPLRRQGQFKRMTDAAGNATEVREWVADGPAEGAVREVQRERRVAETATRTGVTKESWLYDYDADGLLSAVTLRRKTYAYDPTAQGADPEGAATGWGVVRKVVYAYYDGGQAFGNRGDLKTATVQDEHGDPIGTQYYRYYTDGISGGYRGGLKYVFDPKSFARLKAAVGDPFSASDAQVAPYAAQHMAYDDKRRVTVHDIQGFGDSDGNAAGGAPAGVGRYTYAYADNPASLGVDAPAVPQYWLNDAAYAAAVNPSAGHGNADNLNAWRFRTTEGLPDGSVNVIYANAAGGTMLTDHQEGGRHWDAFTRFDSEGRAVLTAEPSAVTGYDPQYADLLHAQGGNYQYLSDHAGLVEATAYYGPEFFDQPMGQSIRQGELGTTVKLYDEQYATRVADGKTVHPLSQVTVYANDDGTGARTTTYTYTSWQGVRSTAVTTTHPVVSAVHNGPGTADVEAAVMDAYGRTVWTLDGDGYIDHFAYDDATSAVRTVIRDVDYGRLSAGDRASLDATGWAHHAAGLHLVTTVVVDALGRDAKVVDPNGNATYQTYDDPKHEVRTYRGWNAVAGRPTGPTEVVRDDWSKGYAEQFTMVAVPHRRADGAPDGTEAVSDVQMLSRSYANAAGQMTASDRYFNLSELAYSTAPALGTEGSNFYRTGYGYDSAGRPDVQVGPTGTETRVAYDGLDRLTSAWIGTSDANLVKVEDYVYDGGGTGDGNLTGSTEHLGGSSSPRVVTYYYDWRDRPVAEEDGGSAVPADGTHRPIFYTAFDNLGEALTVDRYDGDGVAVTTTAGVPARPDGARLRARMTAEYDERGRVFASHIYDVDPTSGAVGGAVRNDSAWYDRRGNLAKSSDRTGLVTKYQNDGGDRLATVFSSDGGGDGSWGDAGNVDGDVVLGQTEYGYDANGNVIRVATRDRFHDTPASSTGRLGGLFAGPAARVSYESMYYDSADRLAATVDVGTNGGTTYNRPAAVPARGDDVLVTTFAYDAAGWASAATDPRGIVAHGDYDALGRPTKVVEASTGGSPTDSTNRTTAYTYDGNDHVVTQTAVMPTGTPDQVTRYVYGVTTAGGSGVNSNDLLAQVQYPDRTSGQPGTAAGDHRSYSYNASGQVTGVTDQNGTAHAYAFDALGRLVSDTVTSVGSGVDGAVRRLGYTYDAQGNASEATSYDAAGNVLNQVRREYDGTGQLLRDSQSHTGGVGASTPTVAYTYDAAHGNRLNGMTYPDGRLIHYDFGSGTNNAVSRLGSVSDPSGTLESYDYLGVGTVVRRSHPQGGVDLTYIGNGSTGDGGDQYVGLDRFGRVADQRWTASAGTAAEFRYGYDRDGEPLYKRDAVLPTQGELYGYDALGRMTTFERGTLNAANTAVAGTPAESRAWNLDALGNWQSVTAGGSTETRSHDARNALTRVGAVTTATDRNGNMTADDHGHTLVYDAWNRLVRVQDAGGGGVAAYAYDATGRRVAEGHGGATTDLYYSDAWQVVEERDRASGKVTAQNVWSPQAVDTLIERDRDTVGNGTLDQRVYVQQDANGNVTSISDAGGNVVERYRYDPYGRVTVLDASGNPRPGNASGYGMAYFHQGGRFDAAAGLYSFRNRDYSPSLGRWMQQDPAGYVDGGNLYQYVGSSPQEWVDPLGLQRWYQGWGRTFGMAVDYYEGGEQVRAAAAEGAKGGASIAANTFSYGYSDQWGWTDSGSYQGADYDQSRFFAGLSRSAFESAAFAAAGKALSALRGCQAGAVANALGRGGQAAFAGLNLYKGGEGMYQGYSEWPCHKLRAILDFGLGALQALDGVKGALGAASGPKCFVAGTQVLMAEGSGDSSIASATSDVGWVGWLGQHRASVAGGVLLVAGPAGYVLTMRRERKRGRGPLVARPNDEADDGPEPVWMPLFADSWREGFRGIDGRLQDRCRSLFSIKRIGVRG